MDATHAKDASAISDFGRAAFASLASICRSSGRVWAERAPHAVRCSGSDDELLRQVAEGRLRGLQIARGEAFGELDVEGAEESAGGRAEEHRKLAALAGRSEAGYRRRLGWSGWSPSA